MVCNDDKLVFVHNDYKLAFIQNNAKLPLTIRIWLYSVGTVDGHASVLQNPTDMVKVLLYSIAF